jgi:hypothetical protein
MAFGAWTMVVGSATHYLSISIRLGFGASCRYAFIELVSAILSRLGAN